MILQTLLAITLIGLTTIGVFLWLKPKGKHSKGRKK